jgi:hypothetical protein
MNILTKTLATVATATVLAMSAFAQSANEVPTYSPLVPIPNQPAPKLFVGEPVAEALARGVAVIPYRVENIRILPVLGEGGANVSPRVGHLHVTVDDLPWHWADFSENSQTIVVAGLPAGQHKLTIELAGTNHQIYTGQTVTFTVPDTASHSH